MTTPILRTYPQLAEQTDVQDADLLASYRASGPLKKLTAATFSEYVGGNLTDNGTIPSVASRTNLAALTIKAAIKQIATRGYATEGDGGGANYVRTSYATIVSAGYPAASFQRSTDRFMPDGSTDATNGGYWLLSAPVVRPAMFGLFTDATVTTATLKAAIDFAILTKLPIELNGDYTVNGPICSAISVTDGAFDLRLAGNVTITVDAAATSFQFLIACVTVALNSHYISGGSLNIVGNDKVERAISLSSAAGTTTAGAEVVVSCPVRITGCYAPEGSGGLVALGINVTGPFRRVVIEDPNVEDLSRHTSLDATGACQAVRVTQARGPITITRPIIRNVLNAVQDADGIFASGTVESGIPICPAVHIIDGVFEDCQGRSIKTQSAHTVVSNPTFIRQGVVSIAQGADVDAQYGSLVVDNWTARYRLNGATSPLGASFRPFVIQALYADAPKFSRIGAGKVTTDVIFLGLVSLVCGANSPTHEVVVDGPVIQAVAPLTTTALSRCVVEFQANQVKASSSKLTLRVYNTSAPNTVYLIGYTGGDGTDLTTKLAIHANNNTTVLAPGNNTRVFNQLSGTSLTNLCQVTFGINPGYHNKLTAGTVNMATIQPGHQVHVDLATVTITNGPTGLPTTGDALIRCGAGETTWWGLMARDITVGNGGRYFYTLNGTWTQPRGAVGAGSPEGVITAPVGTTYSRSDGGAGTSLYVKESGTGNTGWVAL